MKITAKDIKSILHEELDYVLKEKYRLPDPFLVDIINQIIESLEIDTAEQDPTGSYEQWTIEELSDIVYDEIELSDWWLGKQKELIGKARSQGKKMSYFDTIDWVSNEIERAWKIMAQENPSWNIVGFDRKQRVTEAEEGKYPASLLRAATNTATKALQSSDQTDMSNQLRSWISSVNGEVEKWFINLLMNTNNDIEYHTINNFIKQMSKTQDSNVDVKEEIKLYLDIWNLDLLMFGADIMRPIKVETVKKYRKTAFMELLDHLYQYSDEWKMAVDKIYGGNQKFKSAMMFLGPIQVLIMRAAGKVFTKQSKQYLEKFRQALEYVINRPEYHDWFGGLLISEDPETVISAIEAFENMFLPVEKEEEE